MRSRGAGTGDHGSDAPFDEKYAAKLRELIERLEWAIDAAVKVNAGCFPESKEEVA